jgi:hypothetical protein
VTTEVAVAIAETVDVATTVAVSASVDTTVVYIVTQEDVNGLEVVVVVVV